MTPDNRLPGVGSQPGEGRPDPKRTREPARREQGQTPRVGPQTAERDRSVRGTVTDRPTAGYSSAGSRPRPETPAKNRTEQSETGRRAEPAEGSPDCPRPESGHRGSWLYLPGHTTHSRAQGTEDGDPKDPGKRGDDAPRASDARSDPPRPAGPHSTLMKSRRCSSTPSSLQ